MAGTVPGSYLRRRRAELRPRRRPSGLTPRVWTSRRRRRKAVPRAKAQRNFTDPDARIMKMSDGAFHECYNGQAAVDGAYQVIVAADASQCAADTPSLLPMLEQTTTNCGRLPGQ